MTINDVSVATAASSYNVKLSKGQQDQHAKVVDKLIDSTAASSPAHNCSGCKLNVVA